MATVTDLTGSQITITDNAILKDSDSNVNVYEFGNVLLAGLLPIIISYISLVSDCDGSSLSISDTSGSTVILTDTQINNSEAYDSSEHTYDDETLTYDGYPIQVVVDIEGG